VPVASFRKTRILPLPRQIELRCRHLRQEAASPRKTGVPLRYGDERLCVHCWRTGRLFSLRELQAIVAIPAVLPYKTTRHAFDPPLPETEIPLSLLGAGVAADHAR